MSVRGATNLTPSRFFPFFVVPAATHMRGHSCPDENGVTGLTPVCGTRDLPGNVLSNPIRDQKLSFFLQKRQSTTLHGRKLIDDDDDDDK